MTAHICSAPKVIYSGGTMVATGKPAGRTWMSQCSGCLWRTTSTARGEVERLAAGHATQGQPSLFGQETAA